MIVHYNIDNNGRLKRDIITPRLSLIGNVIDYEMSLTQMVLSTFQIRTEPPILYSFLILFDSKLTKHTILSTETFAVVFQFYTFIKNSFINTRKVK